MDEKKLKKLPRPAKIAATQTLKEMGFSVRRIAEIMGIGTTTVNRYKDKELEREWLQFGDTIKKIWLEHDFELAELAYKKMKEKIDRARFFELVGLYKTVRELQQPKEPVIAQQFNVNLADLIKKQKDKYGI